MTVTRREAAAAAAVALLVGLGAGFGPVPTLIVVGAVLVLVMAVAAPRTTVGLAVLVILFKRPIQHLQPADAVSYIDSALVVLCLLALPMRRLATRTPLRTFPGQWWFLAFLVIGLLSGLVLQVPPVIFLSGAFVICKGLLLAWASAQVDWTARQLRAAARFGAGLIVFVLVACAANASMLETWNAVMASDLNAVASRSFLPSLIGPFSHPIDLGQFMALSAVALVAWRATIGKSALTLGLLLGTIVGAALTARRTAAASLAAAWLVVQSMARSTRVLVALLAFLPVVVVLGAGPVTQVAQATYQDYIGKGTPEARTVLTRDSFSVAASHFPVGAGFGRFGSAVAASNYSPEYVARGYPSIWGLGRTPEEGRFLTDTEWPAIIGETGFFGAAAFIAGLVAVFRAGRRFTRRARDPVMRWVGLTVVGWLAALLVESIGTVSFTGPPVSGAFFALVGVLGAAMDAQRDIGEQESPDGIAAKRDAVRAEPAVRAPRPVGAPSAAQPVGGRALDRA